MCTTFLVYSLVQDLNKKFAGEIEFLDYPNLVRLNPNIPWKTRGNAALALRIRSRVEPKIIFELAAEIVKRFATDENANAGIVLLQREVVPAEIQDFSKRALSTVMSLKLARILIEKFALFSLGLRSEQGLVGSLAAVGNTLENDHTFELIAYRRNASEPRQLDKQKILEMSRATHPFTFNSYDPESRRVLIAPHGPDPVLLGIRGESADSVRAAFEILKPLKNLRGWMIFRTNQGTGEHIQSYLTTQSATAYSSGKIRGVVSTRPRVEEGGHVFFSIRDEQGEIRCACYEPTKRLRFEVLKLVPGDELEVGGGVRKATSKHSRVLNLEYFVPLSLKDRFISSNPRCTSCGASTRSEGRGKGYSCRKCKTRFPEAKKRIVRLEPPLVENSVYLAPISAHRHLTKPLQRIKCFNGKVSHSSPLSDYETWIHEFSDNELEEKAAV
jgi:tRNA(Ile2)-agmatinylcytidine synthase